MPRTESSSHGSPVTVSPGTRGRTSVVRIVVTAVLVLAVCAAFWRLGVWQYDKHERKDAQVAQLRDEGRKEPRPLADVLPAGTSVDVGLRFTRVLARGTYDADAQTLLRYRPIGNTSGFHILVPLVTDDGRALVVDRGFVPGDARTPPEVPAPPSGEVEVVARLEPSEQGRGTGADAASGTIRYVDVDALNDDLPYALYDGWAVALSESPDPGDAPQRIPEPEISTGSYVNLAYAYQWWLFIGIGLAGIWFWRRNNRRAATANQADTPGPDAVP